MNANRSEDQMMREQGSKRALSRRKLLRLGGQGGLLLIAGALVPAGVARIVTQLGAEQAGAARRALSPALGEGALSVASSPAIVEKRLVATDGFIKLIGREDNPLYVFGFSEAALGVPPNALDALKGHVQAPSPIIWVDEDDELRLTVTNIGLVVRPDLDDAHTVHWHGFRNQIAIMDGVPELSISIPPGSDFPYVYRPREEGTYFYHCHFEDVEHIQMGMVGIIFVRPAQNKTPLNPGEVYAYNDGDGSTRYDREFALLIQDVWTTPHDNLAAIQETVWSDYKANYWVSNGRAYPDTLKPNNAWFGQLAEPGADPDLENQPISSLIQVNEEEVVLLRLVNLGYEQHAMQLPGIAMKVIGEDATWLGPKGSGNPAYAQPVRGDTTYFTNVVYIGPGESRDVLFTAPQHSGGSGPDVYLFRNRNLNKCVNTGVAGLGGMATEVRVYPTATVDPQAYPNQTFPL